MATEARIQFGFNIPMTPRNEKLAVQALNQLYRAEHEHWAAQAIFSSPEEIEAEAPKQFNSLRQALRHWVFDAVIKIRGNPNHMDEPRDFLFEQGWFKNTAFYRVLEVLAPYIALPDPEANDIESDWFEPYAGHLGFFVFEPTGEDGEENFGQLQSVYIEKLTGINVQIAQMTWHERQPMMPFADFDAKVKSSIKYQFVINDEMIEVAKRDGLNVIREQRKLFIQEAIKEGNLTEEQADEKIDAEMELLRRAVEGGGLGWIELDDED